MMMSKNKRFLVYLALISAVLMYYNLRLIAKVNIFDFDGERLGDSVLENFKVLPANRLVHVSRFGLGHRLIRDASAYHLAKSLDLTRIKFQFGSCAKDNNWRGKERDELAIFPYLFGNDLWIVPSVMGPQRQGKRIIVRNDVYGYVPGQNIKNYALALPKHIYASGDSPFLRKLDSDSEFYNTLVNNYQFSEQVESFMQEHNFRDHLVIGIHLRAGNGEETHFEWANRLIKNETEFMTNFMNLIQTFLGELKTQHSKQQKPLIFLATDTVRLIPTITKATDKFGVKTVHLDQIRLETNGGVTFSALAGFEKKCLEGWQAMFSDMMLLANSNVLIAARHSSFSQSLPLSRVFDQQKGETGPHFCEVGDDGDSMTCLEDQKTWLLRDDPSKLFQFSLQDGISDTQVHRLLIQLPDVEKPKEYADAMRFLQSPRTVNQTEEILMHTYGEKGFYPKYRKEKKQLSLWNLV